MPNDKSGFSFAELLVVILIMSILATVVGISVARWPGRARMAAAKTQIGNFRIALQTYSAEQGFLPTEQQGLDALCHKPTVDPIPKTYPEGGYLDSLDVPKDPWGNDYVYSVPGREGKSFEVISYGRNGEPGGDGEDADISSLEL